MLSLDLYCSDIMLKNIVTTEKLGYHVKEIDVTSNKFYWIHMLYTLDI